MTTNPIIVDQDQDFITAAWRELFVIIWRKETTLKGVEASARGLKQAAARNPGGVVLLTIVEEHAPMPSSEAREAMARVLGGAAEHLKASAVAFEGTGFRAAAVRAVVTSLNILTHQPFPHKVFPNVDEAVGFLADHYPGGGVSAADLRDAVAVLRRDVV